MGGAAILLPARFVILHVDVITRMEIMAPFIMMASLTIMTLRCLSELQTQLRLGSPPLDQLALENDSFE